MFTIPAHGMWGQDCWELKVILGYITSMDYMKPYFKKPEAEAGEMTQ